MLPSPSTVPQSHTPHHHPSALDLNPATHPPPDGEPAPPGPGPEPNGAPSQGPEIDDEPREPPQPMDTAIEFAQNSDSSARTLDELRRRMEEKLLYQQAQRQSNHVQHTEPVSPGETTPRRTVVRSIPSSPSVVLGAVPSAPYADSNGSSTTVTATKTPDQHVPQTPSYPFPIMPPRSTPEKTNDARPSLETGASNVKSPAADKVKTRPSKAPGRINMHSRASEITSVPQNICLPPGAPPIADDPQYPCPNLYDVILKLNSDPGLDAWWANVVEILRTHYGAERASLAVPGDSTDLENVPWGQKATFNPRQVDERPNVASSGTPNAFKQGISKDDLAVPKKGDIGGISRGKSTKFSSSTRPSLLSRHSFAGFGKDQKTPGIREFERSPYHARNKSLSEMKHRVSSDGRTVNNSVEPPTSGNVSQGQEYDSLATLPQSGSASQNSPLTVFTIPRELETETDPLIKRTGIVKLFGRTEPVVLTREYAYDPSSSQRSDDTTIPTPDDRVQTTPTTEPPRAAAENPSKEGSQPSVLSTPPSRPKSTPAFSHRIPFQTKKDHSSAPLELYEEYEQTPPSPWSQSPAPSPAPRTHPEQNPFFTNHAVDEQAFAKDPPPHDYSKVQPLAAIGVDRSKSVVHIPLLHATSFKQAASDILRFPVAVISFLSPIIPYPANLRCSLMYLSPHLTTSFSLAQQYSHLERQLAAGFDKPRFGHLLGLGGTFSDPSSELELVAGLSGHVMTEDGPISARASISSPDEASNASKFSPSFSLAGTPGLEGSNVSPPANEPSALGVRPSTEAVDDYFNLQQSRSSGGLAAPNKGRGSKAKQSVLVSTPTSPGTARAKSSRDDEPVSKDSGVVEPASHPQDGRPTPSSMPTRASSRNTSTTSVFAQLHREFSRPFSDTITQLMLNSVPLHLFLAKPRTGEIIWTNSKFDAYRRSQPQEQRVRDPWQNIHPSELESVSRQWAKALQTGSQFTERVRVKRFNDDSAYRWFIFRANPLLSPTGELLYWIGSFLDVHEQHVAEMKAAQEREMFATNAKYRALANSIPQVVFEAGEVSGLISANEQWHLYTGQTIEEAMNFGFIKYIHKDDLEKCGALFTKNPEQADPSGSGASSGSNEGGKRSTIFSQGVTPALKKLVEQGVVAAQEDENGRVFYTTEIRLRSKGGDYRWHLVRLVKVETSSFGNGEASWYGTCTDINDRKNLERELNKAMQKLNREMESKTKFFSNMSHEIRTPLNGILGTIPFILDTQLDSDQRRMLDTIQNSSTNLRELVDNILDVSRVEAGKMSLVNSWFHVRSVLEDVIDTIASRAIDKGLEMNYLMDVDVPAMVIGDRFRIRQVLINLMGNAVKFTSQGEIYTRCSILHDPSVPLKPTEILLNFEVVDTGKGFSSADAERLMQRFSQIGGSGSQQHAGSGLGLFLSKQLVEMHGGKLTPSSREGQGAKFSFYVKVDAPPVTQDSSLTRKSSDVSETPTAMSQNSMQSRASLSSDSKTMTPQDLSPSHDLSPVAEYSSSSDPSLPSGSNDPAGPSSASASSAIPTPDRSTDPAAKHDPSTNDSLPPVESSISQDPSSQTTSAGDAMHPSVQSTPTAEKSLAPSLLPPVIYSVLILCPLDHAREAIKQHIEQVIPHEVPSTVTSLPDVEDWKDLMYAGDSPTLTHLVLNLPGADDVLEVMQHIQESDADSKPALVIISDLYQKRRINSKIEELVAAGIRVDTVPKPVKPSAFSDIFDPDRRRDLSKDRNQDMAREVNNNFKTMSKMVKEVIGNKGHRILLVEDDETNRMVMLKYLDKIKVFSETASNGQECLEMVFSKEPGYYSLIICDIQMPVKNGYDTCREIRAWEAKNHFPQIPIMALSANAMTDQIDDAARAGFNDYVTKPIKHNELGKMMMGLLDPNLPQVLLRDRRDSKKENRKGSQ